MRHGHLNPFVYFAAPIGGGLIKIGMSKAPLVRLESLAAWSPADLEILATVRGTMIDETAVHYRFRDAWVRHEWFKPVAELLAFIEEVRNTGDLPHDDTPRKVIANWRSGKYRPRGEAEAELRTEVAARARCLAARTTNCALVAQIRRERDFLAKRSAA